MTNEAFALVLGDISLVRALGRAGIRVALATPDPTEAPSLAGRSSALYAGDQLVAAHFGICSAQVWHWWFLVHDHAHARHSPVALLLLAVAEAAAAAGTDIVDIGDGAEADKASFADLSLPLAEGRATRSSLATTLVGARDAAIDWVHARPFGPCSTRGDRRFHVAFSF